MKKSKSLFSLAAVLLIGGLFSFTEIASASETDSFKEEVGDLFVKIPYAKSEVYVQEVETNDPSIEQINVYDKDTNELITEISVQEVETNESITEISAQGKLSSARNYVQREVSQSTGTGYGKAYLKARLEIYSSQSFREIKGIQGTWWEIGSSNSYIEQQNSNGISTTGKFPTTQVNISGATTLAAETTQGMKVGFEKAGFSVSGGIDGKWYARKNINLSYEYSLY
ncbi:hypothetical protein MKY80_01595 [Lysinibacillus sp. FSL R5-0849]|uniref:hypothetical protein n=1 Tax=Lysinibacillus sp. FSL R5-0849 TaxID=2921660 RepID=UPI00315A9211